MPWKSLHSTEPEQQEVLKGLLSKVDGKMFIDVGCFIGGFTSVMARVAKERGGIVYAIDAFKRAVPPMDFWDMHRDNDVKTILKKNMESIGCGDCVEIIEGLSEEVSHSFVDDSFDLIFIDADHETESVLKDIDSWYPKLKKGGIICGHDFDKETVQRAISQRFLRVNVDTAIWSYKKGSFHEI
jgi:predicted O-methyltransferase YrrM